MVQKVAVRLLVRGWSSPCDDLKTLCQPSSEWVPFFELGKAKAAKGKGWIPPLILCPRYSGTLTPTAPTAIRLWKTFTFTYQRNNQITLKDIS